MRPCGRKGRPSQGDSECRSPPTTSSSEIAHQAFPFFGTPSRSARAHRRRARHRLEALHRVARVRGTSRGAHRNEGNRSRSSHQRDRRLGAPAFAAARAVLEARFLTQPFSCSDNLEANVGVSGSGRLRTLLGSVEALRDGKAAAVNADAGRAAVELLGLRRLVDAKRVSELRALIATA